MDWVRTTSLALDTQSAAPFEKEALSFHIKWMHDAPPADCEALFRLLEDAYKTFVMGGFFRRNLEAGAKTLIFTLKTPDTGGPDTGEIVAVRCISEVVIESAYLDAHAAAFGQKPPVSGLGFTVRHDYRGCGVGKAFWTRTQAWMARHSGLPVLFGDTVSRQALEMYMRSGTWFYLPDIERACACYQASSTADLLDKTAHLERLETKLEIRYATPLQQSAETTLKDINYSPLSL